MVCSLCRRSSEDESEVGSPALNGAVQGLADMGARAVVVVDRCPPESHKVLADMVSRISSRLSLITIDNKMPPRTADGTTFKVGEAPLPVVESVPMTHRSARSSSKH